MEGKSKKNQDKKILFSINAKKSKISLREKFKKYKGKNLAKEFTWDKSVGKEIL